MRPPVVIGEPSRGWCRVCFAHTAIRTIAFGEYRINCCALCRVALRQALAQVARAPHFEETEAAA